MVLPDLNLLYSASGFFVGVLVGLTGVGGGALMTPLLVLLFGIHPTTAVGTDLLFASITKTGGTLIHGFSNTVDWKITCRLASGSVPATAITIAALAYLHRTADGGTSEVITTVLGFALILTAIALVFRKWILDFFASHVGELADDRARVLTVVLGVLLGVLVSLTSVGAGAIGVTVLLLLYPTLRTTRIVGSDVAHAVPLTLIAGAGHWWIGDVDFSLLASLLVGSIPGIMIGSHFASRVPDGVLRPLLAGTLALVGGRLAF